MEYIRQLWRGKYKSSSESGRDSQIGAVVRLSAYRHLKHSSDLHFRACITCIVSHTKLGPSLSISNDEN